MLISLDKGNYMSFSKGSYKQTLFFHLQDEWIKLLREKNFDKKENFLKENLKLCDSEILLILTNKAAAKYVLVRFPKF